MTKNYFRRFVWSLLFLLGVTQGGWAFSDFAVQLTAAPFSDNTTTTSFNVKVDGSDVSIVDAATEGTFSFTTVRWNDGQHGWVNCVFTIPVDGPVKVELGDCEYGAQSGTLVDAAGNSTEIKANATKSCWHDTKSVTTAYYAGTSATTLTVTYNGYCPYIAVTAVDPTTIPNDAKVTFDASGAGAQGVAPAVETVELGGKLTIPANTSLYVEGKTLTAWTDGTNNYTIGQEVTVNEDITLTPVFTDNTVTFEERTAEVTATWDFQRKNGAVTQGLQNNSGLVVTQIAIGDASIDVPLYIDATSGKYANANWTDWAQVNDGTKFTLPACKGATFSTYSMNDNSSTTFNGETGTYEKNVNTYTYQGSSSQMEIVITGGTYYRTVTATYPVEEVSSWKDIKADFTGGAFFTSEETTVISAGLKMNDDGSYTRVAADAADANAVITGKYHSDDHGISNFSATVAVEGTVKITIGACGWGGNVTVKDATDATVATVNTVITAAADCYHNDKEKNVVSTYYKVDQATTLTISGGGYVPYFAVEAVDPSEVPSDVKFTYSAGTEATGVAPASETVSIGKDYTLPKNYTLYVEGKTLTGWTDGTNTYAPGETIKAPDADEVVLTPVFTENTVSLADRTEAVTVKWNFRRDQGAPIVAWQNTNGNVWVTQATINNETIDVPMTVNTNPGKFNNANNTDWIQVNGGTVFNIPSSKGATVSMEAFNVITTTTIDGQSDYTQAKTISYEIANKADNIDIVIGDGSYYRYVQVVLPYVEPSAAGTVFDNVEGTIKWTVGNEINGSVSDDIKDGITTATVNVGNGLTVATATYFSSTMTHYTPKTSNAGSVEGVCIEYLVKAAKGTTIKVGNISYDAVKVGTDGAYFSWSYVADGVESTISSVDASTILRNNGNNSSTAQLNHTTSINSDELSQFALRFYISNTANNKNICIGNIVINATVNGTVEDIEKFTLTTNNNIDGAGSISVYPNATEYDSGTEVTLTATENFGYDFVNWTNAAGEVVSEDAKFTYTVDAAAELTANFVQVNTYELALTIEGGAADYMVTWTPEPTVVDGKKMYEDGTQVTLTASSNTILTFNSWSDGNTFAENKLTMAEDKALTATFSAVDFIAAWDFITAGANGRPADFASEDNTTATLILRNAEGNTQGWLDKSKAGDKNTYEGRYCAVNWKALSDKYYYQTKVNAKNFSNIKVKSEMLYNYNAYETQKLEYSLDGETWTTITSVTLPTRAWTDVNAELPEAADHAENLYLRWIPDYTSEVKGSSGNDGTSLANIYILADADIFDDGVAPVLVSTVPVEGSATASATGKIVLNFDEKIKLTENAKATLGGDDIDLLVSGQTVSAAYKSLEYGTNYVFNLAAGSVADLSGNTMTEAVSISFTTMQRPSVTKANYDFIVPDDGSFEDAIAAASARSDKSKRYYIFVKKGEYFLEGSGEELTIERKSGNVLLKTDHAKSPITTISTPNVSIIGESMDETILWNLPESDEANNRNGEGIGTTATIFLSNAAVNTYMQDITLKNAYPYASTTGRAVCLQDKSDKTVAKNVKLLSHQDTYYSNNSSARFYWEDSELHGDVDFLCGGGDVYYNRCNLVIEKRNGNVIAAPNGQKKYGYVFLDCEINPVNDDAISTVNGTFNLGRPWGAECRAQYINTKMNVLPTSYAWAEMGGNKPAVFAEYNSTDKNGNKVDLSSRKLTFDGGTQASAELTATQVDELSIANVMGGDDSWDPTLLTEQAPAASNVVLDGDNLEWDDSNYALLYAIVKNGSVVAFTTENTFDISTITESDVTAKASGASANAVAEDVWAIRSANEMGGLNEAVKATKADAVTEVEAEVVVKSANGKVFNIAGQEVSDSYKGIVIIDGKKVIK